MTPNVWLSGYSPTGLIDIIPTPGPVCPAFFFFFFATIPVLDQLSKVGGAV